MSDHPDARTPSDHHQDAQDALVEDRSMRPPNAMRAPQHFAINLVGGGADVACRACLPEARRERQQDGIVSVARIADLAGDYCMWCGA